MQKTLELTGSTFDYKQYCSARKPALVTELGALFNRDCLKLMPKIKDECVDTIFADPPFNIGKEYGSKVNDNLEAEKYLDWCYDWISEGIRILKPGGAFFIYNIPKWNVYLAHFLMEKEMHMRDWISVDIKFGLPLKGRLYPSHYSLLYFTKGRHNKFHNVRTPIETCRHCGGEIKDYGGHRNKMNPNGVNLADVWTDIPPVRHWKFKSKKRKANALSTKMLDRVVHMTTDKGDLVFDPFGGSGTTFAVCERMNRFWLGCEIESCDVIKERLKGTDLHMHKNTDVFET